MSGWIQSDFLKCILDTIPDALAVKEANASYTSANDSFCQFLNKREEEIVGKTDVDLFPRRSAEKSLKIEAEVVRSGHDHSVVEEIRGVQGKQRLRITKVAIYDETTKKKTKILVSLCKLLEE